MLKADSLPIAFITGRHPYDIMGIQRGLRTLAGLEFFFLSLEDWSADKDNREKYKAHIFYHMHMETPAKAGTPEFKAPWYAGDIRGAIEGMGEGEGLVFLHHGLVAFPDWDLWGELTGLAHRKPNDYRFDQELTYKIEKTEHPINRGLKSWTMKDESYKTPEGPGPGSEVLLTTDHPLSMKEIAWTRQFKKSRVFCYQSGHDGSAFANPHFLEFLKRGLLWSAGLL